MHSAALPALLYDLLGLSSVDGFDTPFAVRELRKYESELNTGMMRQKRKILIIGGILIVSVWIAVFSIWVNKNTFLYSNLMDDESKLKARSLLTQQDIPQENIDLLFRLVDQFNSVPYRGIVEHGWKKAVIPFFSYDHENGFAHLEAQDDDDIINCRSAAFILLKDSIIFGETEIIPTEYKDSQNRYQFAEEDSMRYDLLFADMESPDAASSEALAEIVRGYWKSAGIQFPENSVQLVTVYSVLETTVENLHTGVAIYKDDCIWLIEKIDPIHPYQLACFRNQEQMIDYMEKRASEREYAVIFSNDTCLWMK